MSLLIHKSSTTENNLTEKPDDSINASYVFPSPPKIVLTITMVFTFIIAISFLYFMLIGASTYWFSTDYKTKGFIIFVFSLVSFVVNLLIFIKATLRMKFYSRYAKYWIILKDKKLVAIEELASNSNEKTTTVTKDLVQAVSEKLIPQGHFSKSSLFFMVSDDVYEKQKNK